MITEIDQSESILGTPLRELLDEAPKIVSRAERSVQNKGQVGGIWRSDKTMVGNHFDWFQSFL